MVEVKDIGLAELQMNIFEFVDFYTLLRAYFQRCKEKDKRYSLRYFSRRLGSKSPSFSKVLLDRKQPISEEIFNELTEMIAVLGDQFDYFESLFRLEQYPQGSALHQRYYQRFKDLRLKKPISLLEAQHDCITSWFTLLMREVAALKGASYNPLWFKKCLSPLLGKNVGEIVEAIELLKQAGLLEETETGFALSDPLKAMKSTDPRLKLLHKELIELSLKFLNDDSQNREFGAFAIATTPEKFLQIKKRLREFLDTQFLELEVQPQEGKRVISFSYQLIKLADNHE